MERPLDRVKLQREWYSIKFENARLDKSVDGQWLSDIAGCEFDEQWLGTINDQLVGFGAANIEDEDADMYPHIVEARQEFFESVLNLGDPEHPLSDVYLEITNDRPDLINVGSFIEVQRQLVKRNMNPVSTIQFAPALLTYAPERRPREKSSEYRNRINEEIDQILSKVARAEGPRKASWKFSPDVDMGWMTNLAGHEAVDVDRVQKLAVIGSLTLKKGYDERKDTILSAREEFFEKVLGFGDEDHPGYKTYQKFKSTRPQLIPISSFAKTQKLLLGEGLDPLYVFKSCERAMSLGFEGLTERFANVRSLGLDVKATFKNAPWSLTASPERIQNVFSTIDSFDGIDAKKVLRRHPKLITTNPEKTRERIEFLLAQGITTGAINSCGSMLASTLEHMQERIDYFNAKGLDAARVISWNGYAMNGSKELYEERIRAISGMGLDPIRVIRANPNLLNADPALVRSKLLVIKSILRYYASSATAEEVANSQPMLLTRNKDKMRSVVRMLDGVVDREFMASHGASKIDGFMIQPIDATFVAMARYKMNTQDSGPLLKAKAIENTSKSIRAVDRRTTALDILRDRSAWGAIGNRAIKSYLSYQPLTEKELANYPELAVFANG